MSNHYGMPKVALLHIQIQIKKNNYYKKSTLGAESQQVVYLTNGDSIKVVFYSFVFTTLTNGEEVGTLGSPKFTNLAKISHFFPCFEMLITFTH